MLLGLSLNHDITVLHLHFNRFFYKVYALHWCQTNLYNFASTLQMNESNKCIFVYSIQSYDVAISKLLHFIEVVTEMKVHCDWLLLKCCVNVKVGEWLEIVFVCYILCSGFPKTYKTKWKRGKMANFHYVGLYLQFITVFLFISKATRFQISMKNTHTHTHTHKRSNQGLYLTH